MLVYRADTGTTVDVFADPSLSVASLKDILASKTTIPPEDIILLCEGSKLENTKTLEIYKLPSDAKQVFLYNKKNLALDAPLPPETILGPLKLEIPQQSPFPQTKETNEHIVRLLRFEHQFTFHLSAAEAIRKTAGQRLQLCIECVTQQEVQARALTAAILNLNDHHRNVSQVFGLFLKFYNSNAAKHEQLITTFPEELEKLKSTPLHPSLQTETMVTLLDCVTEYPESHLRKWAQECAQEHEQLKAKVIDLDKLIDGLRVAMEAEARTMPEVDFKTLGDLLQKGDILVKSITAHVQNFQKDLMDVKQAKQTRQATPDLFANLEAIAKSHDKNISIMVQQDQQLADFMNMCASSKTTLTRSLFHRLRKISVIQSNIRDAGGKMAVFQEAINLQKNAFSNMVNMKLFPQAYQACLEEISKRRIYGKKIAAELERIGSALNKSRDEEMARRDNFLSKFGKFVPKKLVPGLTDRLPHFEIKVPAFDANLPAVDIPISDDDLPLVNISSEVPGRDNSKIFGELKSPSEHSLISSDSSSKDTALIHRLQQSQDLASSYEKRIHSLESMLQSTYFQISTAEEMLKHFKDRAETAEKLLSSSPSPSQSPAGASGSPGRDQRVLESRIQELEAQLEVFLERAHSAEQRASAAQAKATDLERQLQQSNSDVQALTRIMGDKQKAADGVHQQLEAAQLEITKLNEASKLHQEKLAELEYTYTEDVSTLRTTLDATQRKMDSELASAKARVEAEEQAKTNALDALTEARSQINQLQAQTRHDLDQKDGQLQELTEKLQELTDKLVKQEQRSAEQHEQIAALKAKLVGLEDELERSRNELQQQITLTHQSEATNKELQQQVQNSHSTIQKSEATVHELTQLVQQTNAELEGQRQQASALAKEFDMYKWDQSKILSELHAQLREKTDKCSQLERDYQAISEQVAGVVLDSSKQTELISQLKQLLNEKEQQNTELTAHIESMSRQYQINLDEKLAARSLLEQKIMLYEQQVHTLEQRSQEADAKQTSLAKEREVLSQQVEQLQAEIKDLAEKLEMKTRQYNEVVKNNTFIDKKTSALEDELNKTKAALDKKIAESAALEKKVAEAAALEKKVAESAALEKQVAELSALDAELQDAKKALQTALDQLTEYCSKNKLPKPAQLVKSTEVLTWMVSTLIAQATELENQGVNKNKMINDLQFNYKSVEESLRLAKNRVAELEGTVTALKITLEDQKEAHKENKIALADFQHNDLMLFLPTKQGAYEAFTLTTSQYFLSELSTSAFSQEVKERRPVLGQVIEIYEKKATGSDNPFKLPIDTVYHEVIIAHL